MDLTFPVGRERREGSAPVEQMMAKEEVEIWTN